MTTTGNASEKVPPPPIATLGSTSLNGLFNSLGNHGRLFHSSKMSNQEDTEICQNDTPHSPPPSGNGSASSTPRNRMLVKQTGTNQNIAAPSAVSQSQVHSPSPMSSRTNPLGRTALLPSNLLSGSSIDLDLGSFPSFLVGNGQQRKLSSGSASQKKCPILSTLPYYGTYKGQLHESMKKNPIDLDEIEKLLEKYHSHLHELDGGNRTLLHLAAANDSIDHHFIEKLLALNPSAVYEVDHLGRLALHYAADRSLARSSDLEVIKLLLNAANSSSASAGAIASGGIYEQDLEGYTALDYFVSKSPQGHMDVVLALSQSDLHLFRTVLAHNPPLAFLAELVNQKPSLLRDNLGEGNLALHHALAHDMKSYEDIEFMTNCYPESIEVKNQAGQLPLHIACMFASTPESIIKLLVLLYPDGVKVTDTLGKLPSDYAIANQLPLTSVYTLTSAFTNVNSFSTSTQITIKLSQDPYYHPTALLEFLVKYNQRSLNFDGLHGKIVDILKRHPNCGRVQDYHRRTPLHLAIQLRLPLESIVAILKSYPEASQVKDSFHRLPIHIVAGLATEMPFELMEELVTVYPLGLKTKDGDGLLPFHLAVTHFASLEWMERILVLHFEHSRELDERLTLLEELFRHSILSNPYSRMLEYLFNGPMTYPEALLYLYKHYTFNIAVFGDQDSNRSRIVQYLCHHRIVDDVVHDHHSLLVKDHCRWHLHALNTEQFHDLMKSSDLHDTVSGVSGITGATDNSQGNTSVTSSHKKRSHRSHSTASITESSASLDHRHKHHESDNRESDSYHGHNHDHHHDHRRHNQDEDYQHRNPLHEHLHRTLPKAHIAMYEFGGDSNGGHSNHPHMSLHMSKDILRSLHVILGIIVIDYKEQEFQSQPSAKFLEYITDRYKKWKTFIPTSISSCVVITRCGSIDNNYRNEIIEHVHSLCPSHSDSNVFVQNRVFFMDFDRNSDEELLKISHEVENVAENAIHTFVGKHCSPSIGKLTMKALVSFGREIKDSITCCGELVHCTTVFDLAKLTKDHFQLCKAFMVATSPTALLTRLMAPSVPSTELTEPLVEESGPNAPATKSPSGQLQQQQQQQWLAISDDLFVSIIRLIYNTPEMLQELQLNIRVLKNALISYLSTHDMPSGCVNLPLSTNSLSSDSQDHIPEQSEKKVNKHVMRKDKIVEFWTNNRLAHKLKLGSCSNFITWYEHIDYYCPHDSLSLTILAKLLEQMHFYDSFFDLVKRHPSLISFGSSRNSVGKSGANAGTTHSLVAYGDALAILGQEIFNAHKRLDPLLLEQAIIYITQIYDKQIKLSKPIYEDDSHVNWFDANNGTLLFLFARNNKAAMIENLLAKYDTSINVDHQDEDGNTALMIACKIGAVDAARVLLRKAKALTNKVNKGGYSTLMLVCSTKYHDSNTAVILAELLLTDSLTLIDQSNPLDNNHTALMYAAMTSDNYALAHCLCDKFNASIDTIKTLDKKTAIDIAREHQHFQIASYLTSRQSASTTKSGIFSFLF